jgi:hypothetical protein
MNVESSGLLYSFFILSFSLISLSVFMPLKIKLLYILLLYVLFIVYVIYIHIAGYIPKPLVYGRLKGFSRVILTIRDYGFTRHL